MVYLKGGEPQLGTGASPWLPSFVNAVRNRVDFAATQVRACVRASARLFACQPAHLAVAAFLPARLPSCRVSLYYGYY